MSIIIPAYNEENHIKDCLDSIAAQIEAPDEVIVVDNNCTDTTVRIARKYSFVKVVKEPVQGLIAARNRGFAAAKGDILGRVDADAKLAPDWVMRVKKQFAGNSSLAGLTGLALAATLPYGNLWHTTFWARIYFWASDAFFRVRILWGANMAIRRGAWEAIKARTSTDDNQVHEDQDISHLLAGSGLAVARYKLMLIETYGQTYHEWPKFKEYMIRRWRTKAYHYRRGTLRNPHALILPYRKTIPVLIIMLIPALLFALTSLLAHHPRQLMKKFKK